MSVQPNEAPDVQKTQEKFPIKPLLFPLSLLVIVSAVAVAGMWRGRGVGAGLAFMAFIIVLISAAFYDIRRKWKRRQDELKRKAQPDFFKGGGI